MTVTASGLGRVERCPTSAVLTQVRSAPNEWTEAGDARHAFLEAVPRIGREAALAAAPEKYREELAIINLERMPVDPSEYAAEVAYAFNWRTGEVRELGRNLKRAYEVDDTTEIAGTCDVEGMTETHAVILDMKGPHAKLPAPQEAMQLLFLAVAASRLRGRDSAFVGHIRMMEDGEPKYFVQELGPMKLDAAEMRIRETMERVEAMSLLYKSGAQLQVVEGEHCNGCPAFPVCPAKVSLARAMAYGEVVEKSFRAEDIKTLRVTDDDMRKVFERLTAFDAVLDRMWRTVREYAANNPIPLGDGAFFKKVDVETESIDPVAGGRVLAKEFGAELGPLVADAATEIPPQKMTWAALDRALRKFVLPVKVEGEPAPKITHLNKRAENALRAGNALKVSSHPEYKVVRPKALKK